MSNLNTVDPSALETVTGGARILSGTPTSLNNNNFLLQSTVASLHDLTRGLRNQNSLFGGNLFGGNGLLTALLFSRLLGPRPF